MEWAAWNFDNECHVERGVVARLDASDIYGFGLDSANAQPQMPVIDE